MLVCCLSRMWKQMQCKNHNYCIIMSVLLLPKAVGKKTWFWKLLCYDISQTRIALYYICVAAVLFLSLLIWPQKHNGEINETRNVKYFPLEFKWIEMSFTRYHVPIMHIKNRGRKAGSQESCKTIVFCISSKPEFVFFFFSCLASCHNQSLLWCTWRQLCTVK